MVFAFAGDVDADALAATLARTFKGLAAGPAEPNPLELRAPVPPKGWRIQLVDKPDRQQTQLHVRPPRRARHGSATTCRSRSAWRRSAATP